VHLASLAGAWLAIVAGFGGLRDDDGHLSFSPRLPNALSRVHFHLCYRGRRLAVELFPDRARYTLAGAPLTVAHYGEDVELTDSQPVTRTIPAAPSETPVAQPFGREPSRRGVGAEPHNHIDWPR
jgi:alpha,alpha-trehalose phosphorylase